MSTPPPPSTSSRIKSWLAEVSPPHDVSLKRSRSESFPLSPRKKTRIIRSPRSAKSACEIGYPDMAEVPKTPTASAKAQAHKRPRTQNAEDDEDSAIGLESSQAEASALTSSIVPKESLTANTRNHRDALEEHQMFFNKDLARERNRDFFKSVKDILTGDRCSAASDTTVDDIQKAQNAHETSVENTYATNVFPLYKGKSRTLVPPKTLRDLVTPVVRDFADDRLHDEGPCYFVKDLLRGPSGKKTFGLTDPRPDLGFGIKKKLMDLNPAKLTAGTKNLIRAAGCLDHCFAITELKGPDGPFPHAVTQAMRAGVALIIAIRELRRRAGYPPVTLGADKNSWVFTMAWEHGRIDVFVCWHETRPDGELYHQHLLDQYSLLRSEDIIRFRRDLHNILDWGLDPQRVASLEKMERDIAAKEAADGKA
ncbi:MAG: hypothetical protein Q9184_005867 [Pyrenodesmia sp. 2 TL-2023]